VGHAERASEFEAHNQGQRAYFERSVKRTMVPADTPYLRRHVAELLRFGDLRPGERVLEVGCGMGRYTLPLARHGLRVEGMDLSQVLLDRLLAYNTGRFDIRVHCGDIADHDSALAGRFDAVVALFALHHLHNLVPSFRGMARALRPSGRVVFVEPNPFNPLYYVQMLVTPGMSWEGERGILRMRRRQVFDAMREAGLAQPAMARFGFFPPFLTNRSWGTRAEAIVERVPGLEPFRPFQLFKAQRP